jgi:hypothetical protein
MRRGAAVHDPWRRLPYGQLSEGSNQASRIPATWRSRTPTAGGSACCRVLRRCEGSVGLLLLLRLGDPLLLLRLRSPLLLLRLGPRVVANPRTGLRGALTSAALLLVAPTTISATSATTITVAASLALALAFAAAPASGGRGGGAARGGRKRRRWR